MFVGPAYVFNVKDVEMTHCCVPDARVSSFDCGVVLLTAAANPIFSTAVTSLCRLPSQMEAGPV
jgi:hypothetical protein